MKLSIILLTYRPGGLDLFGSSLQTQTDKDYELVVIDDCPGRPERGAAQEYLLNQVKAPLAYYGPSKPRNYTGTRMGLCNAMNTGFVKSSGDYVVFIHDYASLAANAVARIRETLATSGPLTLVHGVAHVMGGPAPKPGDVRTWPDPHVELVGKWLWAPEELELFFLVTPARFMIEINGVDERADYCGHFVHNSLIYQSSVLGYDVKIDRGLECLMVDHRVWDTGGGNDADNQWRIRGHHSTIKSEPKWRVPSPNPFNIAEMRKEAR